MLPPACLMLSEYVQSRRTYAVCAILLTLACVMKRRHYRWLYIAECRLGRLAPWRKLSAALIGLLALGSSALIALSTHIPAPNVHDEFSYLLAGDTFAHGRLSNPTHPMWVHFESFHIIQQPTYASKYPPAQGVMLALGQVIGGHPIVGVWMSAGLACTAIYWMMLAWLPRRWALVGGVLVLLCVGITTYWSQSYWGGAVAALGGALVFGALRRIVSRPRVRDAWLMGLGFTVLANSRPYEGLLVTLPAGALLLAWIVHKHGTSAWVAIGRIVCPILLVLVCTAGAMGLYNLRVTGHAFHIPYQVHEATYAVVPVFLWQHVRPEPVYRHEVMRDFHVSLGLDGYSRQRSLSGLVRERLTKMTAVLKFYLGAALTVPLVMLPWVLRSRWMCFALLTCGVVGAGVLGETWLWPHYVAPITGLVFVLVVQAMRYLRLWRWRGRPMGQLLVWAILVVCVGSVVVIFAEQLRAPPDGWSLKRIHILTQLEEEGGRHLIIVRYGFQHPPQREWVYNEADIDGAQVVWAREMDTAQNQKLMAYFADRRVWLLEPDVPEPQVVPYRLEAGS